MAKFSIGDRVFPTKGAAEKAVQEVLHRYPCPVGGKLNEEDELFVFALFMKHPEYREKRGDEAVAIHVAYDEWGTGKTCCFFAERADGTRVKFSYKKGLRDTPTPHHQNVKAAMRNDVSDQSVAFKAKAFESGGFVHCALSGRLCDHNDCEVDHEVPFAKLVVGFLTEHDLTFEQMEVSYPESGKSTLASPSLRPAWRLYHLTHAKLRILDKRAHRELSIQQKRAEAVRRAAIREHHLEEATVENQ